MPTAPLHLKLNLSYQGLFFVLSAQSGAVQFWGSFSSSDGTLFALSIPDGVLSGVLPPAAYFSRQRKVGKS